MKKVIYYVLVLCMILSLFPLQTYATGLDTDKTTDVTVTVSNQAGTPPFLIKDEATLRQALEDANYSILPIQNDIYLESGVPLTTTADRIASLISVPAGGVTIYQTKPDVRHFSFSSIGSAKLTFDNVVLDGNGVGGGVHFEYTGAVLTGAVITNCRTTGNGGGVYVKKYTNPTLINCVVSYNTAVDGGGAYIERCGYDANDTLLKLQGGSIEHNTATNNGGGVFMSWATFYNGDDSYAGASISNNTAQQNGGGIYQDLGGDAYIYNGIMDGNIAQQGDGGAIHVKWGRFQLSGDTSYLTNNQAPNGNGGAIFLGGNHNDGQIHDVQFIGVSKVSFGGNTASVGYWIEQEDGTTTYRNQAVSNIISSYDTPRFVSLSLPVGGHPPFTYANNNFDIAFVGTEKGSTPPKAPVTAFDASTAIDTLVYTAVLGSSVQSVSPIGTTPVIAIDNGAANNWTLKITYDIFNVDGTSNSELKFELRGSDGSYTTIDAASAYPVCTSAQAEKNGTIESVPWVSGENHLLKLRVPADAYELVNKPISTTIYWSLEITP